MEQTTLPYKIAVKNFFVNEVHYSVALTPELYNDAVIKDMGALGEDNGGYETMLTPTGGFKVILIGENIGTHSFRFNSEFSLIMPQLIPRELMVEIIKMMQEFFSIEDTVILYEPFNKILYDFLKFKGVTHLRTDLEEAEDDDLKPHVASSFILTCYSRPLNEPNPEFMPIDSEQVEDILEGVSKMMFFVALMPEQYIAYYKHLQFLDDLDLDSQN